MTTTVHQIVPSVNPGDATTSHTLQLQRLLQDLGYDSEVYAIAVHPQLERRVRLIRDLAGPSKSSGFLIYQLSAHSELGDWVIGRREQIALNYHNITPYRFFWKYDRGIALILKAAEIQVSQLVRSARVAVCDSSFNAADIRARGMQRTAVAPILLALEEFDAEPDPITERVVRQRAAEGTRFLFVGGIAPHKAQHDLVKALALYRMTYEPGATLALVGRDMSPGYSAALRALVVSLGLRDAVDMTGAINHEELVAQYRGADVFVSASDHEGFCVPLLEAMHHSLPVIAYGAGAVPETLGTGGLLLRDKTPGVFAAAMSRVASDREVRRALAAGGSERVGRFSIEQTRATMASVLERWIGSNGSWSSQDSSSGCGVDEHVT